MIIADGGSTDGMIGLAERNGFRVLEVEKTRPHDVSTAKNMGAKYSMGDILFFLDVDMTLDNNCFEVLHDEYAEPGVIGVALKDLPYGGNKIEKAMYECKNYLARIGNKLGVQEISCFSCHAYRKDTFMSLGASGRTSAPARTSTSRSGSATSAITW